MLSYKVMFELECFLKRYPEDRLVITQEGHKFVTRIESPGNREARCEGVGVTLAGALTAMAQTDRENVRRQHLAKREVAKPPGHSTSVDGRLPIYYIRANKPESEDFGGIRPYTDGDTAA